jgi:hypothetical protein
LTNLLIRECNGGFAVFDESGFEVGFFHSGVIVDWSSMPFKQCMGTFSRMIEVA